MQQATATTAMATPPGFLFNTAHGGRVHDLERPHPTVCASDDRCSLILTHRQSHMTRSTDEPLSTVCAGGNHHALLMRNNSGAGEMVTPVTEPARTVTTKDRCALIDPDKIVDDCGFRMLEPHEIEAAMAFPAGYIPEDYSKKDRVKLAGNAVTPPVMQWILGRVAQALEAAA